MPVTVSYRSRGGSDQANLKMHHVHTHLFNRKEKVHSICSNLFALLLEDLVKNPTGFVRIRAERNISKVVYFLQLLVLLLE